MFGRKGQSALEYLMTYGWAILIIIIVGGVLYYYGVFSPGKLVGESKIGFSRVYVDTWGVSGDTLSLIIENRAGKDINITEVYIDGTDGLTGTIPMIAGEKSTSWVTVTIPASSEPDSGEAYQFEVAIEYFYPDVDPAGASLFNSSGTVSGVA